jgi:hypothetical protein
VGSLNTVVGLTIETVSQLNKRSGFVPADGVNFGERGGLMGRGAG